MAIIPNTQKFHTVSSEVDTENKGSKLANSKREAFTMQDITDTVGSGGSSIFEEGTGIASTQRVGSSNASSAEGATVSGGKNNVASADFATVGGGGNITSGHVASGLWSTVGGGGGLYGGGNTASGMSSTVSGGKSNVASASYSTIVGGRDNNTSTFSNTVIAGSNITADQTNCTFVSKLSIKSIPTSAAGLPSGSVWSNGGVLNIVS
jgi:hypothetical protein